MNRYDLWMENAARRLAGLSSRRGFLTRIAGFALGAAALPVLPIARAAEGGSAADGEAGGQGGSGSFPGVAPQTSGVDGDPGDPTRCDYWRYCGIDGFLCSCCGGSHTSCPPGTEMSSITWIGTCRNPEDGKNYVISYNDCCGGIFCSRCFCNRNESDRPMVRPQANNDIIWCFGAESQAYTCTVGLVLGTALED